MVAEISDLLWMVLTSTFLAFVCSFGIGANDVANSFATSVGSKCLTLRQAVMVASVCEFSGAFLMGSHVTATVRKGIINSDVFVDRPDILMLVMLSALFGTAFWLLLATRYSLPVSTTHTIVGGIIGASLTYGGSSAVRWNTVWLIVGSWAASPGLAGIIAGGMFVSVRRFILRKENSLSLGFRFYPILLFTTITINVFFVVYKGTPALNLQDTPLWISSTVAIGFGIVACVVANFFLLPVLRRRVEKISQDENDPACIKVSVENCVDKDDDPEISPPKVELGSNSDSASLEKLPKPASKIFGHFDRNMAEWKSADRDSVEKIHAEAEKFDSQTEELFSFLQIFTAVFDSFAHGSNDVANGIAPLVAICAVYSSGEVAVQSVVPLWILALGGGGIVVGLLTWGWRIILAIGIRLTKITPSRGFSIELGAAFVVLISSRLGIPVSTTHSQVGATIAVGLADGKDAVNWPLLLRTVLGWLVTLLVSGSAAALIFAFAAFSPTLL